MNKILFFLTSFFVIYLAHLIPISYIVGSYASFFSLTTIVAVLVGKYSFLWNILLFFTMCKKITFFELLYCVIKRTPLFFAAWTYKTSSMIVSVLIPLVCVFLFIMHPIGFVAWPYAMYWFIPIAIYFSQQESVFAKAFASVFVAHAVGSVIWIYTHQMAAEMWLALIPVVAIERVLMATTITGFDCFLYKIKNFFKEKLIVPSKELV